MSLSFPPHERALANAKQIKKSFAALIEDLIEIERTQYFKTLEYDNMFKYIVDGLGLSEAMACALTAVSRKSVEIPELRAVVQSGGLSVSTAKAITSVINKENAGEIILKAQTLSKHELEREVARINPKAAVHEKAKFVAADRLKLEVGVSERLMNKIKRVQDIESQRTRSAVGYEESLEATVDFFLEHKDPVRKAQRALKRAGERSAANQGKSDSNLQLHSPGNATAIRSGAVHVRARERGGPEAVRPSDRGLRRSLPAATKHQVSARDQGQCTQVDAKGARCTNRRWLQTHHVKQVAHGGSNDVNNLITLCSAHHKMLHEKAPFEVRERVVIYRYG